MLNEISVHVHVDPHPQTNIYIAQLNRFVGVSIYFEVYNIDCDKEFRMIERMLSAELEDIRFMSDWSLYYTFRRAKLI